MPDQHPPFPVEKLRAAAQGDPRAQAAIDELHGELSSSKPQADRIHAQVESLRKHAPLTTLVANWFEDPRTQAFIQELTAAGL